MLERSKVRIPLANYQSKNENNPVYHMCINDACSGLSILPDGHPKYTTCGHLSLPHLYFHLRGMKKEKDTVIQIPIRHTGVKSESQGGALLPGHRWGIFKWPSGFWPGLFQIRCKDFLFIIQNTTRFTKLRFLDFT